MPTFPTDLTVGQTGVDASLALQNKSTFPQDLGTSTICNFGDGGQFCGSDRGITLIPSCAKFDQDLRTCETPDPGVFKLSATAVGADGSGCQARVFDVIEDDAALGRMRFTPQGGGRITLAPNATCVINFKIDVVKLPATDVAPDAGVQTNQLGSARFVSDVNTTPGQATGTAFGKTIKPPCTPPPGTPPPGGEQCPPPPPCTPPPGPPPPGGELCAPTPPPPPTPIVPGSTPVAPPTARISGKTGCVSKNFNVTVTGTMIRRVVYSLDGKRVTTLSRPNSGSRFVFRVKPGTLPTGVHRVVARTTFTSASGARPRDLRVTFSRCRRARQVPAFTG